MSGVSGPARGILWVLALATFANVSLADDAYVPEVLHEWQDWVLDGKEYRRCPLLFDRAAESPGDFVCAWPETLILSVDDNSGFFTQTWHVMAEDAWAPLPGDTSYWPDALTVNGAVSSAILHDGIPSVRLPAGTSTVTGRFEWDQRPGTLRIPPASGLVSLTVKGQRVARPELGGDGIYLGDRQRANPVRDQATVQVYRLVADDIPTMLTTILRLDIAGAVREEQLGPVLPEGFVPISIVSALPARLEADGRLRVQLRPGRWQVTLRARAGGVLDSVSMPAADSKLPDHEIWSYRANDGLRVTVPEGLTPVDPRQVEVPPEWYQFATFRINRGESLVIDERSRGEATVNNDLHLLRSLWLDFDGTGFVARDHIRGTLHRDWRLDMQHPFVLLNAKEGQDNLLITRGDSQTKSGIELRRSDLSLETLSRSESRGAMPVTGWDQRFASVSTTLYLPPGNKLLLAPGTDAAQGSWFEQWTLIDFFLVLIITLAAGRLFGRTAGLVALLAIVFSFHETGAPAGLWLNLLLAVALLKVSPAGRLHSAVRAYLGVSALLLVLVLVPFIAHQMRIAIYPQLEPQTGPYYSGGVASVQGVSSPALEPYTEMDALSNGLRDESALAARRAPESKAGTALEEMIVSGEKLSSRFQRYAPNAVVQAGTGIPAWQWNRYQLQWSGPVDAGQDMRLLILPGWSVTVFRFVAVGLLLLFAAIVAGAVMNRQWRLPGGLKLGSTTASIIMIVVVGTGLLGNTTAKADIPSSEILQALEQRLLRAPDCVPRCAEISNAVLTVDSDAVRLEMTVDALEDVAVPLPGSARGWQPDLVLVDGSSNALIMRGADQLLWLRVAAGRHQVTMAGATTDADSLEIPFPAPPRVIRASSEGWTISGIKDRRLLSGALQLTRLRTDAGGDGAVRWESSRFPPFVNVSRTVELGLDWRVTTRVQRIAPVQGALSLQLPLLDDESVITPGMSIDDGEILVSMNASQSAISWQSTIPRNSSLTLTASSGDAWTEVWFVNVGSTWHAAFSGVPESVATATRAGVRTAEFHPRGGETLTIETSRPEVVAGATLAFDRVALLVSQGARSRTSKLELAYRSTRGGQHPLQLPANAELMQVMVDGQIEPLRAHDGVLGVPILPGEHQIHIEWREEREAGVTIRTPAVDIGAPSSNINLTLDVPQNRWLLLTRGPELGPAVLYWSELAVLVLFAWLLSRIGWTPLRFRHWLLLGLGFSTFSWGVFAWVVVWLVAVSARDKWRPAGPWWQYNLLQITVVAVTLIAMMAIVMSLPNGLLGTPDMHVTGNGSWGNHLAWFADRAASVTPQGVAVSLPMWVYKVLILGWALWLSLALLTWLPWTWQCFARDGFFRSRPVKREGSSA